MKAMANSFHPKSSFKFLIASFIVSVLAACGKGQLIPLGASSTGTGAGGGTSGGGSTTRTTKRIFVTSNTFDGDLGADAKCMSERPSGVTGTYKAMLASADRTASPTPTNWVLAANQQYTRIDDTTVIGTTTAASVFTNPLTNSFTDTTSPAWTGINSDWTTSADNCYDWTDNINSGIAGSISNPASTTSDAWGDSSTVACDSLRHLICVEQ